jgi:hypothetical protein
LAERKLEQDTDIWEDINWHGEKGHFAPTPEGLTK